MSPPCFETPRCWASDTACTHPSVPGLAKGIFPHFCPFGRPLGLLCRAQAPGLDPRPKTQDPGPQDPKTPRLQDLRAQDPKTSGLKIPRP